MHHIEGNDVAAVVAPEHRPVSRVVDRVSPDRGIEKRHPHAHHSVAAISLCEGVAEDLVELLDLVETGAKWSGDRMLPPRAGRRHQSAAPSCSPNASWS